MVQKAEYGIEHRKWYRTQNMVYCRVQNAEQGIKNDKYGIKNEKFGLESEKYETESEKYGTEIRIMVRKKQNMV